MTTADYLAAKAQSDQVMDLVSRHRIRPEPEIYDLLYRYVGGKDPMLVERLAAFLETAAVDHDTSRELREHFLTSLDMDRQLSLTTAEILESASAVGAAIEAALVDARSFSGVLSAAAGAFRAGTSARGLRLLVLQLRGHSAEMHKTQQALDATLRSSQHGIAELHLALGQAQLEARIDPMTRVFNRGAFDARLLLEVKQARREQVPLSLIFVDIDNFKIVNDRFGHQTGDRVLQYVASTMKAQCKGKDMVARYGGEEFVLLLPQTDLQGAMALAETVRAALPATTLMKQDSDETLDPVTASFGVAELEAKDTSTALVNRADRCLYAAKRAGRNTVFG